MVLERNNDEILDTNIDKTQTEENLTVVVEINATATDDLFYRLQITAIEATLQSHMPSIAFTALYQPQPSVVHAPSLPIFTPWNSLA